MAKKGQKAGPSPNQVMEHSCYSPPYGEPIHGLKVERGSLEVVNFVDYWLTLGLTEEGGGPGFTEMLAQMLGCAEDQAVESRLEIQLPSGVWVYGLTRPNGENPEAGEPNVLLPDNTTVYGPMVLTVVHKSKALMMGLGSGGLMGAMVPMEHVQPMQGETRAMFGTARWPEKPVAVFLIRDPFTGHPCTGKDFRYPTGERAGH